MTFFMSSMILLCVVMTNGNRIITYAEQISWENIYSSAPIHKSPQRSSTKPQQHPLWAHSCHPSLHWHYSSSFSSVNFLLARHGPKLVRGCHHWSQFFGVPADSTPGITTAHSCHGIALWMFYSLRRRRICLFRLLRIQLRYERWLLNWSSGPRWLEYHIWSFSWGFQTDN